MRLLFSSKRPLSKLSVVGPHAFLCSLLLSWASLKLQSWLESTSLQCFLCGTEAFKCHTIPLAILSVFTIVRIFVIIVPDYIEFLLVSASPWAESSCLLMPSLVSFCSVFLLWLDLFLSFIF